VLRSSGEIALCVREDSAEAQKSKNPLRIRKEQSSGGTTFQGERAARTQGRGVRREKRRTKVEAFENWKFFQVLGRKCASSGGSTAAIRSAGEKKIWTVGFYVQEGAGGAHRGGDRQSSDLTQIPVSRWIG
jgi:hypothetical protein